MRYSVHIVCYIVNHPKDTLVETISRIVAENLRRLREERKLSLDAVAKSSGVSKSMLGQIERGVTSPTVSTLWKIAYGLKISFMALLAKPEMDMEIVERDEAGPFLEDEGRYRLYVMFPFDTARKFEMFAVELDAGARFDAAPHQEGTQEFITVFEGTLTLGLNGEQQNIPAGDAVHFRADRPHVYANETHTPCRVSMVMYYSSKGERAL